MSTVSTVHYPLDDLRKQRESAFAEMEAAVECFYYLRERSWFSKNSKLQELVLEAVRLGLGSYINVVAPDFEEHILDLLTQPQTLETKLERCLALALPVNRSAANLEEHLDELFAQWREIDAEVYRLDYALNRGEFNAATFAKLVEVVRNGLGHLVDVVAPKLDVHLDHLLTPDRISESELEEIETRLGEDFCFFRQSHWFMTNGSLQRRLLNVIRRGLEEGIDCLANESELVERLVLLSA